MGDMAPNLIVIAGLIVLVGSAARGFTGFGAMLFTLPLMALVLPVKQAVPLLAALGLANGLWLTWSARKQIDRREAKLLLLGGVPATMLGLYLFVRSTDAGLRGLLGVLVAALGVWLYLRSRPAAVSLKHVPSRWGPIAGSVGGVLSGLYGLPAPPAIFYLAARPLPAEAFRATLLFYITVLDVLISAGYTASGALTGPLWLLGLGLLPLSVIGSWCGERLQRRSSEKLFLKVVGAGLALMGALMVWQWLRA